MASTSAGSLQSGSNIVAGIVPSSSASNVTNVQLSSTSFQQQQQKTLQSQQLQITMQHQQQSHQQQSHISNLQFQHSSQNITIHNRNNFVPRVGTNISHLNPGNTGNRLLNNNSNNTNDQIITVTGSTEMIPHQQIQQQHSQQQQQQNQTMQGQIQQQQQQQQQRQPRIISVANLAPGWRRVISNNEVIYISPSGASLRNHGQIKDYLLSPGTCKCGLPCPLRPEYFFDFNSQVPNIPLQIPLENGLPSRSSLFCLHQRRFLENQQTIRDAKKRKFNDLSMSGKLSSGATGAQCNSVAIYSSGNVMQTSQVMASNSRMNMMGSQQ